MGIVIVVSSAAWTQTHPIALQGGESSSTGPFETASLNVAQAWGKDKEFGSVEKGKIADLVIVRGDPRQNISDTQNVERLFIDGTAMDISYHPDYKNPIPRPIEDRPGP